MFSLINTTRCCLAFSALSFLSLTVQAQMTNNDAHVIVGSNAQLRVDNDMLNSTGGTITNNGITQINGNLSNAGTINGNGSINYIGTLLHTGIIEPGNDNIGELSITGNYENGSGSIAMQIGSDVPITGFDKLTVTGPVTASGTLQVAFINAYNPPTNQTFDLITGNSVTGTFASTNLPNGWSVIYLSNKIQLVSSSTLPIALAYFKGKQTERGNQLLWSVTNDGAHPTYMTLERSDDTKIFYSIYNKVNKNSDLDANYTYEDTKTTQDVHYYRLKIQTHGEAIVYSNIIALQSKNANESSITIAPNPVETDGNTWLNFTASQADNIHLSITDISGKIVIVQQLAVVQGLNKIQISLPSQMLPGLYQVNVRAAGGQTKSIKIVKR